MLLFLVILYSPYSHFDFINLVCVVSRYASYTPTFLSDCVRNEIHSKCEKLYLFVGIQSTVQAIQAYPDVKERMLLCTKMHAIIRESNVASKRQSLEYCFEYTFHTCFREAHMLRRGLGHVCFTLN